MSDNSNDIPVATAPPMPVEVYTFENIDENNNVDENNTDEDIYENYELDDDILEIELKEKIYNRSKVVKYLSFIDMIFLIINFIIALSFDSLFWLFIVLFPLCYLGNRGAITYSKYHIIFYIGYLVFMSLYYIFMSFYTDSFYILIIFFIELYFLIYTIRLYNYLSVASDNVIEDLRDGWTTRTVFIIY